MKKSLHNIVTNMEKRLPYLTKIEIRYYTLVIAGLLRKRLMENKSIIVDGFGILVRKPKHFKIYQGFLKVRGINEVDKTTSQSVKFYPHYDFLKMRNIIGCNFIGHLVNKSAKVEEQKRDARRSWFKLQQRIAKKN